MVSKGEISVERREGEFQLADALTKQGASSKSLLQVLDLGVLDY